MTISVSSQRLFLKSHVWIQPIRSTLVTAKYAWTFDVGLTDRGIDDIGDISSVEMVTENHDFVESPTRIERRLLAGDKVLKINWDAHLISSADGMQYEFYCHFCHSYL